MQIGKGREGGLPPTRFAGHLPLRGRLLGVVSEAEGVRFPPVFYQNAVNAPSMTKSEPVVKLEVSPAR